MPVPPAQGLLNASPQLDVSIGEALGLPMRGNYVGDIVRGITDDQHVVLQAFKELHRGLYWKLDSSIRLAHEVWLFYGRVERAGSLFDENAPERASRRVRPEAVDMLERVIRALEDASGIQNRRG